MVQSVHADVVQQVHLVQKSRVFGFVSCRCSCGAGILCTFRVRLNPPVSSNRRVIALRPVPKHIGIWIYNMLIIVLASWNRAPKAAVSPTARPIREWKTP